MFHQRQKLIFLVLLFPLIGTVHSFQSLPSRNFQGNVLRSTPSPQQRFRCRKEGPLTLLYMNNITLHANEKNTSIDTNNSSTKINTSSLVDSQKDTKSSRGSLVGYFPFLRSSQSITIDSQTANNANINTSNSSATSILLNKKLNETVTVADLDKIISQTQPSIPRLSGRNNMASSIRSTTSTNTGSLVVSDEKQKKSVAFPQPSILSERDIQRGTTIAGSFSGFILGATILPNLWLVGFFSGAIYGYEITKENPLSITQQGQIHTMEPNIVARFLISFGKQLAKIYLQLADYGKAMWFLYKTGQLSYEYYKTYETLDNKFAIQNKVDAWNRVFAEGKQKFDAWEQENEVGRKMLAGLRTAWLVDEQSRMRASGRSRYRLVQITCDLKSSISRMLRRTFVWTQSLFLPGVINTFLKGLRIELQKEGSLVTRLGSILVAVVAVNISGAIYSISPAFCMAICSIVAFVWPSWASDLISRIHEAGTEIQSKGRSKDGGKSRNSSGTSIQNFDLSKFIQQRCEEQGHRSNSTKRKSSFSNKRGKTRRKSKRGQRLSSFFDSIRRPKKKLR
jgi:hypothetical protein